MSWKEGQNVCAGHLATTISPDKWILLGFTVRAKRYDVKKQWATAIRASGYRGCRARGWKARIQKPERNREKTKREEASRTCMKSEGNKEVFAPPMNPVRIFKTEFDVTWLDFPITDNTLLPDGNRFCVFLFDSCSKNPKQQLPETIKIGVLWFSEELYSRVRAPGQSRDVTAKDGHTCRWLNGPTGGE
jgi:hypothetical protein